MDTLRFNRPVDTGDDVASDWFQSVKLPKWVLDALEAHVDSSSSDPCLVFSSQSAGVLSVGPHRLPFTIQCDAPSFGSGVRECYRRIDDGDHGLRDSRASDFRRAQVLTERVVVDAPAEAATVAAVASVVGSSKSAPNPSIPVREMAFLQGVGEGTELPALPRRSTTSTAIASATVTITGATKRSRKADVSKREKQTKKATKKKTKKARPVSGHDSSRDSPWVCVEGVSVHATYSDLLSFFDADSAGPARSIDATFAMGHYTDPSDPCGVADSDTADAPAMMTDVYVVFLTADAAANAALYDGNAFRGPAMRGTGGVRVNVNVNVRLVGAKEAAIAKALGLAWGGAGGAAGGCTDSPAVLRQELLTAGVPCSLLSVRAGGGSTGLLACVNHVLEKGGDPAGHGLTPAAIQGRGTRGHSSRAGLLKGYGRLYGRRHTEGSLSTGLALVPWAVTLPPPLSPAAAASVIKAPAAHLLFGAGGGAELLTSIADYTESLTCIWAALVLEPQSASVSRTRHWASRALCLMHLLHVARMGQTSLTEAF